MSFPSDLDEEDDVLENQNLEEEERMEKTNLKNRPCTILPRLNLVTFLLTLFFSCFTFSSFKISEKNEITSKFSIKKTKLFFWKIGQVFKFFL